MHPEGFLSGLFAAVVIGALARAVVPGDTRMGCLLTILVGLVGSAVGLSIGSSQGWGFWAIFGTQILISTILVVPFARSRR